MAGNEPIKDTLILTRGADFVAAFAKHPSDPEIGAGTTARIEITETADTDAPILHTWNATSVSGDRIEFRIESEQTDDIPDRMRFRLMVRYADTPALDHCWRYGSIKRIQ